MVPSLRLVFFALALFATPALATLAACEASRASQACADATKALEKATQAQLDADTEDKKHKVDIAAAAEKVKCDDEDRKLECQQAKDATLSATKAAIVAIKKANEEQRKKETKVHQAAEKKSMMATDEVAAALQQAVARMHAVDHKSKTVYGLGGHWGHWKDLRAAQRKVDVATATVDRACATGSWRACADAREALEEATQQLLDAKSTYLNNKVDIGAAAEKVKTVPLDLRAAQRKVDVDTATKNRVCANKSGGSALTMACADAREALEEATQQLLDANSTYLKHKVDISAAAEKVKCGDLNLPKEGGKSECQRAKEATLKATIAAIQAIKRANKAQRSRGTKEHQKAEAESMRATDDQAAALDLALQRATARMQGKASFGSVPNFGTTKAANLATSPISAVTLSAVLGLAVVAAVISRRSRSVPPTDTHGLVRDSDENAADEHCTE